ncbi:hypothetical protein D3C80_438850 [compost metagenome]
MTAGTVGQFGDQHLRLRQSAGDRRAQLVCAVGGELPLGIECCSEPHHQQVDGNCDRLQFARQDGRIDRLHIAAILGLDFAAQFADRFHSTANHQPDHHPTDRNQQYQRKKQSDCAFSDGLFAVLEGICNLNEDFTILACRGVELIGWVFPETCF